jgi:hypothetical protein
VPSDEAEDDDRGTGGRAPPERQSTLLAPPELSQVEPAVRRAWAALAEERRGGTALPASEELEEDGVEIADVATSSAVPMPSDPFDPVPEVFGGARVRLQNLATGPVSPWGPEAALETLGPAHAFPSVDPADLADEPSGEDEGDEIDDGDVEGVVATGRHREDDGGFEDEQTPVAPLFKGGSRPPAGKLQPPAGRRR